MQGPRKRNKNHITNSATAFLNHNSTIANYTIELINLKCATENYTTYYRQTSVFELLAVRTIRFSNGKFEMKITRSSNKNSVLKQLKRKICLNQVRPANTFETLVKLIYVGKWRNNRRITEARKRYCIPR